MSSFAAELNELADLDRTGMAVAYGAVTLAAGAGALGLGLAATPPHPRAPKLAHEPPHEQRSR